MRATVRAVFVRDAYWLKVPQRVVGESPGRALSDAAARFNRPAESYGSAALSLSVDYCTAGASVEVTSKQPRGVLSVYVE
jgi:hypothetical protein